MKTKPLLTCAYTALICGSATAAAAQTADAPGATASVTVDPPRPTSAVTDASSQTGLQEIVVTATRRATDLQRTPVAVAAISAATIQQAVPTNIGDIAKFVPNFSAAKQAGFNAASFAMRGVGQNNIIVYFEPPVAVLVDDFVNPSVQGQLLDTFDIQQVEVLRGPQGTLFGKNTTGGAVSVTTKRPDLDGFKVEMQGLYGKYNTQQVQGAVDVPIVPGVLAIRAVATYNHDHGYYRNGQPYGPIVNLSGVPTKFDGVSGVPDGSWIGGTNVWNGRLKLLYEPSSAISELVQYEILRDNSPVPAEVNTTPPGDQSYLFNLIGAGATIGDPFKLAAVSGRNDNIIDEKHGSTVNVDGVYSNTNVKIGPGSFTNVIGWRYQRSKLSNTYMGEAPRAADGSVLSLFDSDRADHHRTFQEELRFASSFEGPFNFVAGGFYQHDRIDFCSGAYLGFLDLLAGPTPYGPYNNTPYFQCSRQTTNSSAGFAEGNLKLLDGLTLTGGIRYTWEHKTWMGRQQVPAQLVGVDPTTLTSVLELENFAKYPQGVITIKEQTNKPTYRGILSYQFTPTIFAYGSYSHGFKSGGFNDNIGSLNQFGSDLDAYRRAAAPTKPEYADSYEIGLKTEFFEHRLRVNLTGFHVKYRDLQRQVVVPIIVNGTPGQITAFFNAASSRVNGVEGEISAVPIKGLTLGAVFGYQDGKYLSYNAPITAGYNLAQSPLDRTPKWQTTFSSSYAHDLGPDYKVLLSADLNYTGRNLFTQSVSSLANNAYLNAHTLLNASITLAKRDDGYFVRLVGQNLTNRTYKISSQDVGGLWQDAQYGRPRFFAVQAGVKFGAR